MNGRLIGLAGALWLACGVVVFSAEQPSIPSSPLALSFDERQIQLPIAEGRRRDIHKGTVVYLAEDHTLPLVEVAVALRAGSFLEPPLQAGLASLTGALVRRGGTRLRSADSFDDRVDELGARITSFAGFTRSAASLSVPTWALDEALDLFFEVLSSPAFQEDRLESVKTNLRESMSRRNQDPLDILEREWQWLVFGRRHFSTRPLTPSSLEAMDTQALIRFHQTYWRPENLIFAVSGDFQVDTLLASLEERIARWSSHQSAQADSRSIPWPPEGPSFGPTPGLYHYEADFPQAKVALGARLAQEVPWDSEDRFALEVLGEILGGSGAISRVAGRLRTAEGLVYRASARLDPGELWVGDFQVFFDTSSSQVARAVELSLEEVNRILTEPVHTTELEVAKLTLLGKLRLSFDTAEEIAGLLAENELLQRPDDYWDLYLRGIEATTADDILRAASTYLLPDQLLYLVVGRWHDIAQGAPEGQSQLEKVIRHRVRHLPARDPLTLRDLE
ncbi:MAG: pitrilysin family protein [Thermoanaerobaculia bacterium]